MKKWISSHPAFCPLSNLLLEENQQKNNKNNRKPTGRGTSEREPAVSNSNTPGGLRPGADLSCLRQYNRFGPWKIGCVQ